MTNQIPWLCWLRLRSGSELKDDRRSDIDFRELYWSRRRNTGDVFPENSRRKGEPRYIYEQDIVRLSRAFSRILRRGWLIRNDRITYVT